MNSPDPEGESILKTYYEAYSAIQEHTWPELTIETVVDDGETWRQPRCPWCEHLVEEDSLRLIDSAERSNTIEWELTDEGTMAEVMVFADDQEEFETLLITHECGNPVTLPEGTEIDWA